jgi:hypothetical protein
MGAGNNPAPAPTQKFAGIIGFQVCLGVDPPNAGLLTGFDPDPFLLLQTKRNGGVDDYLGLGKLGIFHQIPYADDQRDPATAAFGKNMNLLFGVSPGGDRPIHLFAIIDVDRGVHPDPPVHVHGEAEGDHLLPLRKFSKGRTIFPSIRETLTPFASSGPAIRRFGNARP